MSAALKQTILPTPEDGVMTVALRPVPAPRESFFTSPPSRRMTVRPGVASDTLTMRPRRAEDAPMTLRSGDTSSGTASSGQPVRGAVRLLRFDLEFLRSLVERTTSPMALRTLEAILSDVDRIEKQVSSLERREGQSNLTSFDGVEPTLGQR